MSKINNLLNQIVKNNMWESNNLIGTLFNEYEQELVEVIKNMNEYLTNENKNEYSVAYIMLTLNKLVSAIYYYNNSIDGVSNKNTPILNEVITVIKSTEDEAIKSWIEITEKK